MAQAMEGWVLEGESYSFLRSTPHTFNLRNRDEPNRVEIFDITNIPSHRSAISETTCLCDIFGDDCEPPSLSSSPASATIPKKEVVDVLPAEDNNDSSGSYHTAEDSEQLSDSYDSPEGKKEIVTKDDSKKLLPLESHAITELPMFSESGLSCPPHPEEEKSSNPTHQLNVSDLSQNIIYSESESIDTIPVSELKVTASSVEPVNIITSTMTAVADDKNKNGLLSDKCCTNTKYVFSDTALPSELRAPSPCQLGGNSSSYEQRTSISASEQVEIINIFDCRWSPSPDMLDPVACTMQKNEMVPLKEEGNISCEDMGVDYIQEKFPLSHPGFSKPLSELRGTDDLQESNDVNPALLLTVTPDSQGASLDPSPQQSTTSLSFETEHQLASQDLKDMHCSSVPEKSPHTSKSRERNLSPGHGQVPISPDTTEGIISHNEGSITSPTEMRRDSSSPDVSDNCSLPEASPQASMTINSQQINSISPSIERTLRKGCSPELTDSFLSNTILPYDTTDNCTESILNGTSFTPNSQNCNSPDHITEVFSPEVRKPMYSPVINEITCSVTSQDTRSMEHSPEHLPSAQSQTITHRELENSSVKSLLLESNNSVTSPNKKDITTSVTDHSIGISSPELRFSPDPDTITVTAPSSKDDCESCPENRSRVSTSDHRGRSFSPECSNASDSDTVKVNTLFPEIGNRSCRSNRFADILPEEYFKGISKLQGHYHLLPIIRERETNPSPSPSDDDNFSNAGLTDSDKSTRAMSPELENKDTSPFQDEQSHKSVDITPKLSSLELSSQLMDEDEREITVATADPSTLEDSVSPNVWLTSGASEVAFKEKEQSHWEENGSFKSSDMLEKELAHSGEKQPMEFMESPSTCHSGNGIKCVGSQEPRESEETGEREKEEEPLSVKGEEKRGDDSYREEQVELSLSTRNRKGPASDSPAPRSRDSKSRISARFYSESHPATRQQQLQVQGSQLENKGGARKVKSVVQGSNSGPHCFSTGCPSETSSMGSEIDEADNEVKWLTDQAFSSLSSSQADYLDVYNSSHRSSTNVSQASIEDSPGAAAWMSYADLHGSTICNYDDFSCQHYSFFPRDGLDSSKRFEMGSFECVDVALESREEVRGAKRTVPKRQIQLKRRNNNELSPLESTEESLSTQRISKDKLLRQHSTPAAVPEDLHKEEFDSEQANRKQRLKKSLSLDEASTKNKMASCIIKNVLSKKMQDDTKQNPRSGDSSPSENKSKPPLNTNISSVEQPAITEELSRISSQFSDHSLSSEDLCIRDERSPQHDIKQQRGFGAKPVPKSLRNPSSKSTMIRVGMSEPLTKNVGRRDIKPQPNIPLERRKTEKQNSQSGGKQAADSNLNKKNSSDSANACAGNTSPSAIRAEGIPSGMLNREEDCQVRLEKQRQQGGRSVFMSKTTEIVLKPCNAKEKKKSSLRVSLSPDLESPAESLLLEEKFKRDMKETDDQILTKMENDADLSEDDKKTNMKGPMHKVRDVRKLVKNTYNLSFMTPGAGSPANESAPQAGSPKLRVDPPPLQIQCKAINVKENKVTDKQDDRHNSDISKVAPPEKTLVESKAVNSSDLTVETSSQKATNVHVTEKSDICSTDQCIIKDSADPSECRPKLGSIPKASSREREVSTVVFLQDGSPNSMPYPPLTPSPRLKATCSGHTVSMLLKEKGMQADIGVCDIQNDVNHTPPKHVNRLEVPLQTCSTEGTTDELQTAQDSTIAQPQDHMIPSADPFSTNEDNAQLLLSSKTKEQPSMSPKAILTDIQKQTQRTKELTETVLNNDSSSTLKTGAVATLSYKQQRQQTSMTASKEIELPIQVRSIDRPKPAIPPKPSFKPPKEGIRSISSYSEKPDLLTSLINKQQTTSVSDVKKSENQATSKQEEPSTDATSNYTSKSHSSKAPVSIFSSSQGSATAASPNDVQMQPVTAPLNLWNSQQQNVACSQRCVPDGSKATQALSNAQPVLKEESKKQPHADFHFCVSDDPPSYDERECFSPLSLSDIPPRRLNRCNPMAKHPQCSCSTSYHSHHGHMHHSSPPMPLTMQVPDQVLSYSRTSPHAQMRPHFCRPDGLNLHFQRISPKPAPLNPPQAPSMAQLPPPCSAPHSHGDSRQHIEGCTANHCSPQHQAALYNDRTHSPKMPSLETRPQFLCNPDLAPPFAQEYGSEGTSGGSVLYQENPSGLGYGQGPRRVLLDPDTGKYFYIEVPMQPLRKMLFDPETGQYVEVLIPQQAMTHSSLYPSSSAPYSSLHSPNMYAAPYLPYAVPPHHQGPQQPRHPDAAESTSAPQTSIGYRSPAAQAPKLDPHGPPPLDQSYLESMYYIPTGMNASPNVTSSDCYPKPLPNIPKAGGRGS